MSDETTRAVNDAVDWDNRKQLADLWQEHARLDSLDESTYDALIAVAEWGARSAIENAEFDGHPQLQVERDAARAELGEMQAWQNELAVTIMGEDEGDPDASQESIIMRRIQRMQAERDGLAARVADLESRIADAKGWNRDYQGDGDYWMLDAMLDGVWKGQHADGSFGPSPALTAHDGDVAARALDEAAEDFATSEGVEATAFAQDNVEAVQAAERWLRDRAKAIRDGSAT